MIGRCRFSLGEYRRAVAEFAENVRVLEGKLERERFGANLLRSVSSLNFLAWCHAELGEFSEADTRTAEAIRIAEAAANPHTVVAAYASAGYSSVVHGDVVRSVAVLEKAMAFCRESHIMVWFQPIASLLGYSYALAGRPGEAVEMTNVSLSRSERLTWALTPWMGETYLIAGDLDRAHRLANRALERSVRSGQRGQQARTLRLLGEVAVAEKPSDAEAAEARHREALSLANELGMRPLVAHCHLGLGKLFARTGKCEQAREYLTTATTMYREMDMRFYLEQAEAEMGA